MFKTTLIAAIALAGTGTNALAVEQLIGYLPTAPGPVILAETSSEFGEDPATYTPIRRILGADPRTYSPTGRMGADPRTYSPTSKKLAQTERPIILGGNSSTYTPTHGLLLAETERPVILGGDSATYTPTGRRLLAQTEDLFAQTERPVILGGDSATWSPTGRIFGADPRTWSPTGKGKKN